MEINTENYGKLMATRRADTGKGVARKLRDKGLIPAVCYGGGKDAIPLTLNPDQLRQSLDPAKGENTIIDLTVEDPAAGTSDSFQVMVKDYQMDPIKQTLLHADFLLVYADTKVQVTVPLDLEGKPEGVKTGGVLHQVFRTLPVNCIPSMIPERITLDISAMEVGDTLRISELDLPEGIKIELPDSQAVVQVMAPRAATEEETEAEEGEEGEEGAEEGEDKEGEDKDKKGDKKEEPSK